jgi:hypothetical protein
MNKITMVEPDPVDDPGATGAGGGQQRPPGAPVKAPEPTEPSDK